MESGQSGDGASHGHTSTVVETAKEEALAGGYDEEEEDCTPLPNGLICSRQNWETMYGKFGAFEDETDASPMRNTDRPVPPYYLPISMMQFFLVKVIEIMGGLQWPLHVYGIVATRDSQDNKRNFLFRCDREHCQTLASPQDSCLRLTRPSRAIVIVNPVVVEVDLKSAVEATITVGVVEGSPDFRARFTARTAGIDEDVLLLDFQDGSKVVVDDDGFVVLRRRVVSVEGTGKLILRMEATDHGGDDTAVVKEEIFCARKTSRSQSYFMLGFCKLSIIIAWSLLP
ncbi:hypothetical protein OsI_37631 [Oryza sativa Indica Group]|uniref:DUF6598 domain-containing protein n=1 Tax=Oryza sativa subsp. indica TaxID=39946 RepID=A2ZII3_ORYSI|nr:hypothetical protein OsI_37631 [Oryza sativa Indica Group]